MNNRPTKRCDGRCMKCDCMPGESKVDPTVCLHGNCHDVLCVDCVAAAGRSTLKSSTRQLFEEPARASVQPSTLSDDMG